MFITKSRLTADLVRWQAAGWVDASGAEAIRADLDARTSKTGIIGVFAVLGALLLGCAAISFVAANWQDMSKLLRLSLLGGGIVASYGAAYELFHRKLDLFGHAAVLLGIALFGASIMLIAQMYHMEGNPPDAVWLWAVGALAAGLLVQSNPALGAAIALTSVWSWMVYGQDSAPIHWGFLPMWVIAAGGVAMTRWRAGMHLLAITLSVWLMTTCLWDNAHSGVGKYVLTAIGLGLAAGAAAGREQIDRWRDISGTMLTHGILLAYVGLFTFQFSGNNLFWGARGPDNLWLTGGVTLALLCAAMAASWRAQNPRILRLTYALFAFEIFAIYLAKVGTLLGTSAFFFVAGLLLMSLAVMAYRLGLTKRNSTPGALS